jgi:quercetin dioxygenase-like cupin family protein
MSISSCSGHLNANSLTKEEFMDVRSSDVTPFLEHDEVIVHSMVPKFTMREETLGGYLELVDVFEIPYGARPTPHYHDTHEFFFILAGEPIIQIGNEARKVKVGDLIHVPRNAPHQIRATTPEGMRGLSFSISYQEPFHPGYINCELEEVDPA